VSVLPAALPPVVDAHVHVFPERVQAALWRWFSTHAWEIQYKLQAAEVLEFLLSRGLAHLVLLHYSHREGMARSLNRFVAELARWEPRVTAVATVLPGEPDACAILEEGWALGLRGVKLHCHVQCFAPDAPELREIYALCAARGQVLVMHAGRAPRGPGYRCDSHELCAAERVERVLLDHPTLKLCVPHLGIDEFSAYERLLERHDNLWLDTTMVLAEYFDERPARRMLEMRPDRVMYGTDFPNIPYDWDRELVKLVALGLPEGTLAAILGGTARTLHGV
jgi:predicted TIM-barrel fold metal-dependent hydrolase